LRAQKSTDRPQEFPGSGNDMWFAKRNKGRPGDKKKKDG